MTIERAAKALEAYLLAAEFLEDCGALNTETNRQALAAEYKKRSKRKLMPENLVQVIVDDEADTVRLVGRSLSDRSLFNIVVACAHEVTLTSHCESNIEKARRVMKVLGVIKIENLSRD